MRALESRRMKTIGAFLLWGLVCFAVGNGHATQTALEGSSQWWQGQESRMLSSHLKADRERDRREAAQCRLAIMNAE